MAEVCDFDHGEGPKTRFFAYLTRKARANADNKTIFPEMRCTYHILAVILDDIEMLRDRLLGKQREEPVRSNGYRSVVGTAEWNKLKEIEAA